MSPSFDEERIRASMTPLPIWLSTQGILVSSTNLRTMLEVILRLAPAPTTSRGCLHACSTHWHGCAGLLATRSAELPSSSYCQGL